MSGSDSDSDVMLDIAPGANHNLAGPGAGRSSDDDDDFMGIDVGSDGGAMQPIVHHYNEGDNMIEAHNALLDSVPIEFREPQDLHMWHVHVRLQMWPHIELHITD